MRSKGRYPVYQGTHAYELDVSSADAVVSTVTGGKFDAGILYVGGAGNLEIVTSGDLQVTLTAVPVGTFVRHVHIKTIKAAASGTTATALVLLCA